MERPDQELQRPAAIPVPQPNPLWGKGTSKAGKGWKGIGKAAKLKKGFSFNDAPPPMPMNADSINMAREFPQNVEAVGAEESPARVYDEDG